MGPTCFRSQPILPSLFLPTWVSFSLPLFFLSASFPKEVHTWVEACPSKACVRVHLAIKRSHFSFITHTQIHVHFLSLNLNLLPKLSLSLIPDYKLHPTATLLFHFQNINTTYSSLKEMLLHPFSICRTVVFAGNAKKIRQ